MEKLLSYFSFDGRANRQRYWLTSLALVGMFLVAAATALLIPLIGVVMAFAAAVAFFWAALALSGRRLHDRNKSALWLLPMYLPVFVLSGLGALVSMSDEAAGAMFDVLTLPFSLWAFIELGCLKGTPGPNRFGADPLQPTAEVFA